jgi:hypothetical protein
MKRKEKRKQRVLSCNRQIFMLNVGCGNLWNRNKNKNDDEGDDDKKKNLI